MHQTAEVFAREAGITDAASGVNLPDNFLSDWWCLFWDSYNLMTRASSNDGEDVPESSAQAQALSQDQGVVQVQEQVQFGALSPDHMLDDAYAQALYPIPVQAQAHAQAEIQAQASTFGNNGMLGYEPYGNTLGQIWEQRYYANNTSLLSEPTLASAWDDEHDGVLPCYSNADFQPGWAFPETSRNARQTASQISRRLRRQALRARSQVGKGNASNPS